MTFFQEQAKSTLRGYISALKDVDKQTNGSLASVEFPMSVVQACTPGDEIDHINRVKSKSFRRFTAVEVGLLREHGALIGGWYDYIPAVFSSAQSNVSAEEQLAINVTKIFAGEKPSAPGIAKKADEELILNALILPEQFKKQMKSGKNQRNAVRALKETVETYTRHLNAYLESGDYAIDVQEEKRKLAVEYFARDVENAITNCVQMGILNRENISTSEDLVENSILALMATVPAYAAKKSGVVTVNSLIRACSSLLAMVDSGSMKSIGTSIFVIGFTIVAFMGMLKILSSTSKKIAQSGRGLLATEKAYEFVRDKSEFERLRQNWKYKLNDVFKAMGRAASSVGEAYLWGDGSSRDGYGLEPEMSKERTYQQRKRLEMQRNQPNLKREAWRLDQTTRGMFGSVAKTGYDIVQTVAYAYLTFAMMNDMFND